MNGIVACCTGRCVRDAETRFTASGKQMVSVSIAVDDLKRAEDAAPEWLKVTAWNELAEAMADKLVKGTALYAEGRLKLNTWTAADGTPRSGLELIAWTVQPMGQIGQRKPRQSAPEPATAGARSGSWFESDDEPY
jgi:single-strand DNA-binding protein